MAKLTQAPQKAPPSASDLQLDVLKELLEAQRQHREANQPPPKVAKADITENLAGYLVAQGLTEDEARVVIVNAIYGFAPEGTDVPVEAKLRLMEVKQQRQLRDLEQRQAAEAKQREAQSFETARQQGLQRFELLGRQLEASKYQASAIFFDDPAEYAGVMESKANELVRLAEAQGIELPRGDSFVELVQAAVEESVGGKLTKAEQRRANLAKVQAPAPEGKPQTKPASVPGATTAPAPSSGAKASGWMSMAAADKISREMFRSLTQRDNQ